MHCYFVFLSDSSHKNSRSLCLGYALFFIVFSFFLVGLMATLLGSRFSLFLFNRGGEASIGGCASMVSVRSYSAFH